MKKAITFLLVAIFCSGAYAQQKESIKDSFKPRAERQATFLKTREAAAGVTSLNKYITGSTMDLTFELNYSTSVAEYGDYFEMTFPTGVTPNSGTDPIAVCNELSYGQIPCKLNAIEGQKISWGDDNNNYGGIEPGTHVFVVNVTISEDFTGDLKIAFAGSGDEYKSTPPHEFDGEVVVRQLDGPDLEVMATGYASEYFSIPFDQVSFTFDAFITNTGEQASSTIMKISGADFMEDINVPELDMDEVVKVKSSKQSGYEIGDYSFKMFTALGGDKNKDNDTAYVSFEVSENMLVRDNGDVVGSIGIGSLGGILGNVFTVAKKDTLDAVVAYHNAIEEGNEIYAVVYSLDQTGAPKTLIAKSLSYYGGEQNTEYMAYFAEGVVLEEGAYFIGMVEGSSNMQIGYTSTPYVDNSAWAYFSNKWNNLGAMGFKHTYYLRPVFGGIERPELDVEAKSLSIYNYQAINTNIPVTLVVKNNGIETVTALDVEYTVNGGTPVKETLTVTVPGLAMAEVECKTPVKLTAVGDYTIKVKIGNANGKGNDVNTSNDEIEGMISALEYAPTKRVVGEEATGTWCGWCVRGHVFMEEMAAAYPNWIGIAVHNNDPMVVTEYDNGIKKFIGGYPSGLIDRVAEADPADFEAAYEVLVKRIAPVDVTIQNINYNETTKALSFDVQGKFLAPAKNLRFNAVLVEEGVKGTTAGYNQANYYAGGNYGEMGGYESKPNPVPAADMVYNDVSRAILGGWDGTESSLPANIATGEVKSYTYTTTLKEGWNVKKMAIVGMIIDQNSGAIMNAIETSIITSVRENSKEIVNVYPNPTTGNVYISAPEMETVTVYSLAGSVISTSNVNGTSTHICDLSSLKSGIYVVSVKTSTTVETYRIVKQ